MLKRLLFLTSTSLTLASCQHETVFTEVKINDRYSLSVPEYLQPCTDLHVDASLQYQSTEKNIYGIVIDEKKKTMQNYDLDYDIDLYFKNIATQGFIENIIDPKISTPVRKEIDGHKALISDISGKVDQNNVYYKQALIETDYEFYQILIWTLAENKEKLEEDMITMIESFKELPHPKEELPEPKVSDSVATAPVN